MLFLPLKQVPDHKHPLTSLQSSPAEEIKLELTSFLWNPSLRHVYKGKGKPCVMHLMDVSAPAFYIKNEQGSKKAAQRNVCQLPLLSYLSSSLHFTCDSRSGHWESTEKIKPAGTMVTGDGWFHSQHSPSWKKTLTLLWFVRIGLNHVEFTARLLINSHL